MARGIENQTYVIGVNRVGTDGTGLNYTGDSCIVDPLGEKTACQPNQEQVLCVTLSWNHLNQVRLSLPFLKDISC